MNNRYPQTPGMNPAPGIPKDYPYGPTLMLTSNSLCPSGVVFAPNISDSPYPTTAFISGNSSNSSYPACSSRYLLAPNNSHPVLTSSYPSSSNNIYLLTISNNLLCPYTISSNILYSAPALPYLTSSNKPYPASSNSHYSTSCNSPYPAPTLTYPYNSNRHYPASNSSYPAPPSMNQPPGSSMVSRGYDSKFGPSIRNNKYPQRPGMIPPLGIPRDYPYGPTLRLTSNPLYSSGVGFAPNTSASPYPSTAFTSGNGSTSSFSASSSCCLPAPNNPYPVSPSPYPSSSNNPYPASYTNLYPASASPYLASSNKYYPASGSPYPASFNRYYPASNSSYSRPTSMNQPPGDSPYPSMGSRGCDSRFGANVNEANDDALNINSLPIEIILKIFSYLTQNQLGQIARVCKSWNVLTKTPVFWKKVNVEIFFPSEKSDIILKSFINGLPSRVTSITLHFTQFRNWIEPLDFEGLCLRLQEKCPHLEELTLVDSDLSNSLFSVIVVCIQLLHDVKNLIFHHSTFGCHHSTGVCLGISKIKILELFNCYLHHPSRSPFSKMPHLKQLHLYGTEVENSWFEDDISFLNQLHVLNLGRTWNTAETFQAIQNQCPNLKELYLCSSFLQDHDLNFINSLFPHLKTICLRCPYLTCEAIVSFIQSCSSLENVYVNEAVAESFAAHPFVVANRCKSGIVKAIDWNHKHNVDYSHN